MIKKFLFGFMFVAILFLVGCDTTTEETEPPIDPSITVSEEIVDLYLEEVKSITVSVAGTTSTYEFVVADTTVVSIEGDSFTGLKKGTTTVTVRLVDTPEIAVSITINVLERPMPVSIQIQGDAQMELDTTQQLVAAVTPEGASSEVVWSVSDEDIISISDTGEITALAFGTTTITAQSKNFNRIRGTLVIEVVKPSPTEVNIDGQTAVEVEKKISLSASVLPVEAAQDVIWSVDDTKIASINEAGELTGLRTGIVTVTARTVAKSTILATIIVEVQGPSYIEVRAQDGSGTLNVEDEITMSVNVYPAQIENKQVTWSSSDTNIATVNQLGEVVAIAVGSVTISATLNADTEIVGTYGLSILPKETVVDPIAFVIMANTPEPFIKDIITYGADHYEVGGANVRANIISSVSKLFGGEHEVRVSYMPGAMDRPNLTGINYITIHDTGNTSGTATAQGHVNFLASVPGVSWHYTIDENEIVQHLPDHKRGAHAGNTTGNAESIGLEMAINFRADHYRTWQRSAQLVAHLLVEHNLGMNRIRQHYDWSGKDCPRTLRNANLYPMFIELIQFEYDRLTIYKDYQFVFESHNPEIISNEGRVIGRPLLTTTVSYTVHITNSQTGYSESVTLYSTIPGRLAY